MDAISLAALAIGLGNSALQLAGKVMGKKDTNGHGRAIVELELKLTKERHEEMESLETGIRNRVHDLANRVNEMNMRHEQKVSELDTEVKLLKQLILEQGEGRHGRRT